MQIGWLHYIFLGTDACLRFFIGYRYQKKKENNDTNVHLPNSLFGSIKALFQAQHPLWEQQEVEIKDKMAE